MNDYVNLLFLELPTALTGQWYTNEHMRFSLHHIPESRSSFNSKHLGTGKQHHNLLWWGEQVSNRNLSETVAFYFTPCYKTLTCRIQTNEVEYVLVKRFFCCFCLPLSCPSVCEGVGSRLQQSCLGCRDLDIDSCEELEWDYNEAFGWAGHRTLPHPLDANGQVMRGSATFALWIFCVCQQQGWQGCCWPEIKRCHKSKARQSINRSMVQCAMLDSIYDYYIGESLIYCP